MVEELFPHLRWDQSLAITQGTLYMAALPGTATSILGITLGLALFLTARGGLFPDHAVCGTISLVVNISRSISFIILIVLFIPFTKAMVGTILDTDATLPTLIVGAAPFYARLVKIALREVDKDAIEATRSMDARLSTLIFQVLLPESSPAPVSGATMTLIVLMSYSSTAGVVSVGGLGNLAYLKGFQRNHSDIILVATVTILLIIFITQLCGDMVTSLLDKR